MYCSDAAPKGGSVKRFVALVTFLAPAASLVADLSVFARVKNKVHRSVINAPLKGIVLSSVLSGIPRLKDPHQQAQEALLHNPHPGWKRTARNVAIILLKPIIKIDLIGQCAVGIPPLRVPDHFRHVPGGPDQVRRHSVPQLSIFLTFNTKIPL